MPVLTKTNKYLLLIFTCSSTTSLCILAHFYNKKRRAQQLLKLSKIKEKSSAIAYNGNGSNKKALNSKEFSRKLKKILKILIPKWNCAEVGFMGLISGMLVIRSLCDVWMIYLGTLLESSIISKNRSRFNYHLMQFAMTIPTMAMTNSLLKYSTDQLHNRFRTKLTDHILNLHLKNLTYYKLQTEIANPDQLIATDIDKFSHSLAHLYSQLSKPMLDIVIYVYGISASLGKSVPITMMSYLALAAGILVNVRKPMSLMTSREQMLEGDFRFVNSRLITNSEEVAFYNGGKRELSTLLNSFKNLMKHLENFTEFKFLINFMENIIAKYIATIVGYYTVSRPFFNNDDPKNELTRYTHNQRLEAYYKSGRMLISLSQAIGRLVMNGKEISRLNGYTSRVNTLLDNLKRINAEEESNNKNSQGEIIIMDNIIKFENCLIATPNGDCLIKSLNLEVKKGTNVLVCGPNGSGKSSLFRVLGDLWPLKSGRLFKPEKSKLFYIPQRPYMCLGTLRDQVIYPDSENDMKRKGKTDRDLIDILRIVDLEWLIEENINNNKIADVDSDLINSATIQEELQFVGRRRSFGEVDNWMDVLSGGQKQRLAMARLLYHSPQFAILDECTSAVSVDVEAKIYNSCKENGITLFTVTHRKSLWVHHDIYLWMDGRGDWGIKEINKDDTQENLQERFGS